MKSSWSKISLFFLLIIAVIGTLMRSVSFFDILFQYQHLLHAHSHVAFQGWIYTLMLLFVPHFFLSKSQINKSNYTLQFKITIPVIFGILISFSLQGYGLFSIIFSSLFLILNFWFFYRFFIDTNMLKKGIALSFIRVGLFFGFLSSLAPIAIGILSSKGLQGSEAYQAAIYFFLHFQYNGWFLLVAFGLLFKYLDRSNVNYNKSIARYFYYLICVAVIPAFALSLLGMSIKESVFIPALIAGVLQLIGLYFFLYLFLQLTGFPETKVYSKCLLLPLLFLFLLS